MLLDIPRTSGIPLQFTLSPGERLYVVGANGSGKSALIQHLVSTKRRERVRRISAHRQTWFRSESLDFTPQARRQFDQQITHQDVRDNARWSDQFAEQRQSAVLFDLISKANERARLISHHVDRKNAAKANLISSKEASPFDQINELLSLGTLPITLELSRGEEILARHHGAADSYSIAQMSDGERNAAIIAATVLTVQPGTVLLIDEPERHLHRSIVEPFLSALFQRRVDCMFVISTHEIALPTNDQDASALILRSCSWNGGKASTWDAELLEPNDTLPEELRRAVLGSRKRILFVEGDNSGSLDFPLYSALFPSVSIVPKGGCVGVSRAVSGLKESKSLHDVEAYGLIDRDGRPDDEVEQLANENIFALEVISVESLYYCSDSIAAVAHRQAETFELDATHMVERAHKKSMTALMDSELRERMAAMRCERQVRNRVMSRLPSWESIRANSEKSIFVEFPSPLEDEKEYLEALVESQDLNKLVSRYPLRKSNVFDEIARSLMFSHRKDYEQALLSRIRADANLAQKLKRRIEPLAKALEK